MKKIFKLKQVNGNLIKTVKMMC